MKTVERKPISRPDIKEIVGIGNLGGVSGFQLTRVQKIVAACSFLVLALLVLWMMSGSRASVRYVTEQVDRGRLVIVVSATGTMQPTNVVDISSELSGTIRKVLVGYNSKVKTGQSLAELDTDKLKASVDSARARLAAARARIADVEATAVEKRLEYERQEQLAKRQVTTEQALQIARASYARANAAVASAKADAEAAAAELKLTETNLAKTCICSPINGVVLKRNVEPGQTVATSLQAPVLFTIAEDLTKMEVQVDVDEADVGKVKEGQHATFSVDAYPGRKFSAQIRDVYLGSQIVQGVVTYKAILTTENKELLLRPGMTATAEIVVEDIKDALSVPNAALRFSPDGGEERVDERGFLQKLLPGRPSFRPPSKQAQRGAEQTVWILANGNAVPVSVKIGTSDGRRTQIVGGDLRDGQAVIVDSASSAS